MKNKQKAWRKLAAKVKAGAKRDGKYEPGTRYGRKIKLMFSPIKAFPSNLFLAIAGHAGICKVGVIE